MKETMPEAFESFNPQLTGIDKAAILLTMLGVDHSASILQHLGEGELEPAAARHQPGWRRAFRRAG